MPSELPFICPRCGAPSGSSDQCESCGMTLPIEAKPGESIRYLGDFELLSVIGRGGMGVVYRARQLSLNRIVALKLLLGGNHACEKYKQRFHQEAELASRLQHPGIVTIYETGEHEGQPYIAMEYVEGTDLATLTRSRPLSPATAAAYVLSAAKTIQYAHERGVLHRDLKPANLMLSSDGQIRLTDFGLARDLNSDASLTLTGAMLGSPGYMPPEQISSSLRELGPTADIYALGAVLYHLLCGRAPFMGGTVADTLEMISRHEPVAPAQLNPSVPPNLERICLKCLEKHPLRRYRAASHLASDLENWMRAPGTATTRRRFPVQRALGVLGACAALALAAGLWRTAANRSPSEPANSGFRGEKHAANADRPATLIHGSLRQELFHSVAGPGIAQFTNSWRFPVFPDAVHALTHLESELALLQNTGMRISGLLFPPKTGSYTFYLSARDETVLLLGLPASNTPMSTIAWEVTNWDPRTDLKRSWNVSAALPGARNNKRVSDPVSLEAGRPYRIELLTLRQSHLPFYVGVTWRQPGESLPQNGQAPIPGNALAWLEPASPIGAQPEEITVHEGERACVRVGITSPRWTRLQWWKGDLPVADATNALFYTPPQRRTDSGTSYSCVLFADTEQEQVRSRPTVVRVIADEKSPRLVSAAGVSGTNLVCLTFDERLEAASARNLSAYAISPGLATNALLSPDERSVVLTLQNMPRTPFEVRVTKIRDWAGNPLDSASVPGLVSPFQTHHLSSRAWGPRKQGLIVALGMGDFDVFSEGRGYGGNSPPQEDDFEFVYQRVSGDFEASVLISRFDNSRPFAHAGLMVRASLAPDAAHLNMHVNPPEGAGTSFINYTLDQPGPRAFPTSDDNLYAGPSGVPNAWLKIQRKGDMFSFYRSDDGRNWKLIRSLTKIFGSEVLVGTASAGAYSGTGETGFVSYRQLAIRQ